MGNVCGGGDSGGGSGQEPQHEHIPSIQADFSSQQEPASQGPQSQHLYGPITACSSKGTSSGHFRAGTPNPDQDSSKGGVLQHVGTRPAAQDANYASSSLSGSGIEQTWQHHAGQQQGRQRRTLTALAAVSNSSPSSAGPGFIQLPSIPAMEGARSAGAGPVARSFSARSTTHNTNAEPSSMNSIHMGVADTPATGITQNDVHLQSTSALDNTGDGGSMGALRGLAGLGISQAVGSELLPAAVVSSMEQMELEQCLQELSHLCLVRVNCFICASNTFWPLCFCTYRSSLKASETLLSW
jgi:hypothetical protein